MSSQAQITPTPYSSIRRRPPILPRILIGLITVLVILAAGGAAAYLVVHGSWHIAVLMILAVPAVIILHRYPYLAVVAWLFLSPFLVQTMTDIERQIYWVIHRGLPPFTILLILLSAALHIRDRELPRLRPVEYIIFAYVAVSLISIFMQHLEPVATAIRFYDRVIIPMCLYLIIRLTSPGRTLMKWLVPIALFITVTQVSIGILMWIKPSLLPSSWLSSYAGTRTTGSVNSPSVYSTALVFTGSLLLHTAMNMRKGFKRTILIAIYLSTFYAIFISYSRACWLMGLVVIVGLFIIYPRFFIRVALIAVPILALAGGVLLRSQLAIAQARMASDQTALSRLPVLVAAYRMFQVKPIFGWGYANFDRYDREFQGRFGELVNPDEKDLTSHNVYMTLLAEQGLVGTALWLAPLFILLWRSWKSYRLMPKSGWMSRKTLALLWLVVLSFFVVNNFAPMVVVFGLGLYWVNLGLIAAMVYAPGAEI